ncbi:N-acetylglucosamine-6-phosphate deacetylase [Phaeovulum sp.]|uniref:N-acetylglucosamine-6-phosphate deacetylase n=1 Tax=Phaeovulum sp. TaxID=2934796 RepID=UPI002730A4A2|nr:N-acetylglucosamine-6-phosphate deacetylase [Phaeovulum sp.]MDP1667752.1 N-acetylglucosamine-6-phosphate deacetylase [Phaeovulum sp.]MDZ4118357.1 N-acetylglucosamine-6-phosphate deacetylase [Phaeovulum sp.]
MALQALIGARIFDGTEYHAGAALVLGGGQVAEICAEAAVPNGARITRLAGGLIAPGFVDAQVNGGGGVLLNDAPTATAMQQIADAHAAFGTTSLLPTLISDRPAAVTAAIAAAVQAVAAGQGVAGLHLEGPHLAPARKGTHLPAHLRPMTAADEAELMAAVAALPLLVLTVAPEQVSLAQVARLAAAGAVVCLGHTDCDMATAQRYFAAGARGVTHLFNAMSGLGHRAPGLVGAALDTGTAWGGIIADGTHVDPASLRIALRAKRGPGRLFLVTDAMSLVGTAGKSLTLDGRKIRRESVGGGSRLTLADGTLAGSDLDMASAVRFAAGPLEQGEAEALRMASLFPAQFLRLSDRGHLAPGARADLVYLDAALRLLAVWRGGALFPAAKDLRGR